MVWGIELGWAQTWLVGGGLYLGYLKRLDKQPILEQVTVLPRRISDRDACEPPPMIRMLIFPNMMRYYKNI
jgi:hypothetical protein